MIQRVWKAIKKFFIDEEFNKRMDDMVCTIDDEPVDMAECDGIVGTIPKTFAQSLERRGFTYNQNNNRWSRTWTAKTRDAEERTLEVYEKKEDGEWISLMYGNEGDIYYQNSLGYETLTES